MTKQEKIREAYGLAFNNSVNSDGWALWSCTRVLEMPEFDEKDFNGLYILRPRSLRGIEDNNGWTKIESEDDLPKGYGYFTFIVKESGKQEKNEWRGLFKNQILEHYSHWRLIIESPNPLY